MASASSVPYQTPKDTIELSSISLMPGPSRNNLPEVLAHLKPSQWLRHQTIWYVLEWFMPDSSCVVGVGNLPTTAHDRASWAPTGRIRAGASNVLVTVNVPGREHWVLLHYDLQSHRVMLLDSLRTASDGIDVVAKFVLTGLGLSWEKAAWTFDQDTKVRTSGPLSLYCLLMASRHRSRVTRTTVGFTSSSKQYM